MRMAPHAIAVLASNCRASARAHVLRVRRAIGAGLLVVLSFPLTAFAQANPGDPTAPDFGTGAQIPAPPQDATGSFLIAPDQSVWRMPDPDDRPIGSAFFGGDTGPAVFGPDPDAVAKDPDAWPNISEPGPDMGDFPNSAFTLPKGRVYVEFSPATYSTADRQSPASYFAPFLLRYGLTDAVELRLFGNGLTHVAGTTPSTGLSPLNVDMKIHLWNDRKEWLIPAASLEVYVQTVWGSSQFNSGWQPSLNMNFDLPITKKLNLEWTLGYTGVRDAINIVTGERFVPRHGFLVPLLHRANLSTFQLAAQWAVEYDVNDQLQVFVHGFHNGAILFQQGAGEMVGAGLFWKFSPRLTGFGSLNAGLSPNLPSFAPQIGFAVAL